MSTCRQRAEQRGAGNEGAADKKSRWLSLCLDCVRDIMDGVQVSSDGRLLSTTPLLRCLLLLFLLQRDLNLPFSSLTWFHVSLNYKRVSVLV